LRPAPLPTPATPLIGRAAECATVHAALAASRLVTLTGVGGTGKTRLALQVAGELTDRFPDGVAFADLAPLRDPTLIPIAIIQALGMTEHPTVPAEERLTRALAQVWLLLVVDNLEHLVEEAGFLARLLAAAPALHILATSRVPLRLYGEHEIRVPPLRLPADDPETADDPGSCEAVQLFVQRARAVRPDFQAEGEGLATIGAICVALDGLPLAIELAAARTKLFTPDALLPRLDARLALLTGGPRDLPSRQQTLRATLDWSYTLLAPEAQTLFARLGVFAGSFDAAAAATICRGDDGDGDPLLMLERLAALADQSLVEVAAGPTPRFRLLETLREYALARLAESGEQQAAQERQARYFTSLAEDALVPNQPASAPYFALLELERDNLRAAMEWAGEEQQAELGLRLVCAHRDFWVIRGHCIEGHRRAEEALSVEGSVDPLLRSRALFAAGRMARLRGDLARAIVLQEQALVLAREAGDVLSVANACQELGVAAALADDHARARPLLEESLALMREANSAKGIATTTHGLAAMALKQGQLEQARVWWEESVRAFRELGERATVALVLFNLGLVALLQGELERSKALLLEGLTLAEQVGYRLIRVSFLEPMAAVAVHEGEPASAARFLGAAEVARAAAGYALEPVERAIWQQTVEAGRAQLGEAQWDRAWQEGRGTPLPRAVALARAYGIGQRGG
jgi:predicted ATPase